MSQKEWVPPKKKVKGCDAHPGGKCQMYFQVRSLGRRSATRLSVRMLNVVTVCGAFPNAPPPARGHARI